MNKSVETSKPSRPGKGRVWIGPLLLFIVLFALFWRAILPDFVVFSNDGPYGLQKSAWLNLPQSFLGQWYDLNVVGANAGSAVPDLSILFRWPLGPLGYAKFSAPLALFTLGLCAWFFFRRSGMKPIPSILGGLAAALTSGYFTNAAWGAIAPVTAFGMVFLALGALAKRDNLAFWIAPALAGLAVGMNVMEAADIGALFSILVAVFVVYQSLTEGGSSLVARTVRGVSRAIIVGAFAFFIAAYAVSGLIGANIKGITGAQQDTETKAAHYDFATQWSMPKRETLALMIPNLFGCNVVTPGAANYWGGLGTDPAWDHYFASDKQGPPPERGHFIRHTGRGIYLGTLVVLVAFWGAFQSFRKKDSVFTLPERKVVWFWIIAAVVSLLFAYGRYAPFYQLVYRLPYFSTIRNPDKFLHLLTFAMIVLFGYGLHGLNRRFLDVPLPNAPGGRIKSWWAKAAAFDRRWVVGSILVVLLALGGWALYASMRGQVENHLAELQRLDALRNGNSNIDMSAVQNFVASQVSFSLQQVGWFILLLTVSSGLLLLIFSGAFAGRRALWGGILLGVILVGDLARANLPYVIFWNYKEKYEAYGPNAVIKFLSEQPYEHRVAALPFQAPGFNELYGIEWTQQLFPFYDIQTLDIVQMPRKPQDLEAFDRALTFPGTPPLTRRWELTNTRYLLGPSGYYQALNQQLDPALRRFRIVSTFDIVPKPFVQVPLNAPWEQLKQYGRMLPPNYQTAMPAPGGNGEFALFEFTGALPRAKLYSNWQTNSPAALKDFTTNGLDSNALEVLQMVGTNDFLTLQKLVSPSFDPSQAVLLPEPLSATPNASTTNQDAGTVKFTSYHPADISLEATPTTASVLMLNDKYDPAWQVWVDGKQREVLRCNFLMRGVYLEPGHHEVEFKFRPHINMLYVNLVAIVVGACLLGYAIVTTRKRPTPDP